MLGGHAVRGHGVSCGGAFSRSRQHDKARWLWALSALASGLVAPCAQAQQTVSPVTVTPSTLAPEHRDTGFQVDIPEAGALRPPAGAQGMVVALGAVHVDGSFPEVADPVEAVVDHLRNRRVTLAEIYAAASQIEEIHARAGYVLARVSVPPQQLADGGDLRLTVTDGFVESVDVSGLPQRVRGAVRARTRALEGQRHVTMARIEQALMIASDVPGLALRSTLMRGEQPGGTRLVLEGRQRLLSGSLGGDNNLAPSLGRWDVNLQLALNSALGLGEQIYGFVSSGYQLDQLFDKNPRERVLGGGVILPLGDGRISLNPEVTFARTAPTPLPGTPASIGTLRRLTLRANGTVLRRRTSQAALNLTVEQIEEANELPGFNAALSRDRYMAARFGGAFSLLHGAGTSLSGTLQYSRGLGDLGAISASDAIASGVPFSRLGAGNDFDKLVLGLRAGWQMGQGFSFDAMARGQTSFGKPLLRAEQMALEGSDGLSAYLGGITALDAGVVARAEVAAHLPDAGAHGVLSALSPYGFMAYGTGRLEQPTALERGALSAFNLGAGLRATLLGRLGVSVEYARGFADYAPLDRVNRVNFSTSLRF